VDALKKEAEKHYGNASVTEQKTFSFRYFWYVTRFDFLIPYTKTCMDKKKGRKGCGWQQNEPKYLTPRVFRLPG